MLLVLEFGEESLLIIHRLDSAEELIDLNNEVVKGADMGEKTLRNQDAAVVLAGFGASADQITDVVNNTLETPVAILALLGYNDEVGLGLEGALNSHVRRGLTHEADEVPVLDSTGTIGEHVTDELGVDLGGGIEANSSLNVAMVDIAIDGGRNGDDSDGRVLSLEILSKVEGVSHGGGGANKNKTGEAESGADFKGTAFLLIGAELIRTTADVIVSTEVDVVSKVFASHHSRFVRQKAVETVDEADKLDIAALSLIPQKTIDDVVTAGSLSAHVDETDLLGPGLINGKHALVKGSKLSIAVIEEASVCNKIVLNLDEVASIALLLENRELLIHLGSDKLGLRLSALGASHRELATHEHIGDLDSVANASLGELREKLELPVEALTALLKLLNLIGFRNELFDIGRKHHEV